MNLSDKLPTSSVVLLATIYYFVAVLGMHYWLFQFLFALLCRLFCFLIQRETFGTCWDTFKMVSKVHLTKHIYDNHTYWLGSKEYHWASVANWRQQYSSHYSAPVLLYMIIKSQLLSGRATGRANSLFRKMPGTLTSWLLQQTKVASISLYLQLQLHVPMSRWS